MLERCCPSVEFDEQLELLKLQLGCSFKEVQELPGDAERTGKQVLEAIKQMSPSGQGASWLQPAHKTDKSMPGPNGHGCRMTATNRHKRL